MALRRVRSKSEPKFDSIVSDEWLEAFPDDFDVLPDIEPPAPVPAAPRQTDESPLPPLQSEDDSTSYR
jgi:hypothetical protein